MVKKYYLFIVLFFVLQSVFAQEAFRGMPASTKLFPFGVIEEMDSKALSEKRILNIYLPQGYHPDSAATYPVIYVLDGSAHEDFPHIAGLVQFLNMYDLLPKSIVVGIANVDRYRDFTHLSSNKRDLKGIPTAGGSAKFIQFLEEEVQPLVKQKYKTNGHRTIIGQSLGGLLASEILLTKPEMFDDYLIVSPSLWWGERKLVKSAPRFFKAHPELEKRVYISLGTEHPVMTLTAEKLAKSIQDSGNEKMTVFHEVLPNENHATVLHRAVYRGFELLYPKPKE